MAAAPAHAAAPTCTITGFTPRTVAVGLVAVTPRFAPQYTGCSTVNYWNVRGPAYSFYASSVEGVAKPTFAPPATNGDQPKAVSVGVQVQEADYDVFDRSFPSAFSIKRRTGWDRFDAGPEPVRRGQKITIKGRLRVVDWTKDTYVGYAGRLVSVQFRTANSAYRQIRVAKTGADGSLTTTVTASADGSWRLYYSGNAIAGGSTVVGDFVDVR